jgi:hypothetical protein
LLARFTYDKKVSVALPKEKKKYHDQPISNDGMGTKGLRNNFNTPGE